MKTTYKYTMPAQAFANFIIPLPEGAKVVKAAMQGADRVFWAVVESEAIVVDDRTFRLFPTGAAIPEHDEWEYRYIDTFFEGHFFVWHLYKLADKPPF